MATLEKQHAWHYAIVGNGITGITAAEILRAEDPSAEIIVIADDPFPAYYRPALKDYLAGRVNEDKLWARPTNFYQDHAIRFMIDRVVGIQVRSHYLELLSGKELHYQRLLLAQGAHASTLSCPGLNLEGVTTLRTVNDYSLTEGQLSKVRRVVVAGSGTLALETIETLRHRGHQVTHLLRKRTLWSEVLDATASDLVLQQEQRDGVEVRLEEEIAEIIGKNGRVTGVMTTSGARIPCEMVIIAIGINPIIDFVQKSGIPCGRGIKVDAEMRTGAEDIFAAGDVLETTDVLTGNTRVIGQWFPAIQQARTAAYAMLGLLDTHRLFSSSTFYNASFLYGLDFASVGITHSLKNRRGYEEFIADPQPRNYRKVVLKDGIPVGALALGNRRDIMAYKRAIDHRVNLSTITSRLFSPGFNLNTWLDKQGVPAPILSVSRQIAVPTGAFVIKSVGKSQPVSEEAHLIPAEGGVPLLLSQTQPTVIGSKDGISIQIKHPSISPSHAEISYNNGRYMLKDLGSADGTFLNQHRLEGQKAQALKNNDQLRFGRVSYLVDLSDQETILMPALKNPGATQLTDMLDRSQLQQMALTHQPLLTVEGDLELPGARQVLPANVLTWLQESPALIVIIDGVPEAFFLLAPDGTSTRGKKLLRIGRDQTNDVILNDISVSRFHAEIVTTPIGFYLGDLKSSNGVLVNQMKITHPYQLRDGDQIMIGSTACFFIDPQITHSQRVISISTINRACNICGKIPESPSARFCRQCGFPLSTASQEVKR